MSDWRPINSAPKDGTYVDLWFPATGRKTKWRWYKRRKYWGNSPGQWGAIRTINDTPTHWMPQPEDPDVRSVE